MIEIDMHARHKANFLSLFLLALLVFQSDGMADISFIDGNWSGTIRETQGTLCLLTTFRAISDVDFTGDITTQFCGGAIENHCRIHGQIHGTGMTATVDQCQGGNNFPCTVTGNLNSGFTTISGTSVCPRDTSPFQISKEIAVQDVSVNSGISNNSVQTTGVQWIDFNGDRRLDLVLIGRNGNALFKNAGKGKFVDVTKQVNFSNEGRDARGASWADIDNNGLPDVFVANATGAPTLLLNVKGKFKDISNALQTAANGDATTRAGIWVDINNDKLIDLFVIKDRAPNQLFQHTGATSFQDIAVPAGLAFQGSGRSAVAADFNGDGFQDLYLANFKQPNKLYINNGNETFTEESASARVAFKGASVQVVLNDFNRDQLFDILIVNNAGPSFLYENLGNVKFRKIVPPALKNAKKGIAAAFADYDQDADEDLVLAQTKGGSLLFSNDGKGRYRVVHGIDLNRPDNPTGITVGDFNNDGTPDIAIGDGDADQDRGDSLYKNDGGGANNHLTVVLQGKESNRSAIGANVLIQTGLIFQQQEVTGGNGQEQNSFPLVFGIGQATTVDSIRIIWPSGIIQTVPNVPANQTVKIVEQ